MMSSVQVINDRGLECWSYTYKNKASGEQLHIYKMTATIRSFADFLLSSFNKWYAGLWIFDAL